MPKLNFFFVLLALVAFTACGRQQGSTSESTDQLTVEENISSFVETLATSPIESDAIETANLSANFSYYFHTNEQFPTLKDKLTLNDEIIRKSIYHFDLIGQSYQIQIKEIEYQGESGKYLTLKLYDENEEVSRAALNRLAKKVNVRAIYIDLVSNAMKNAGGYFSPNIRDLYLGSDYIISQIVFKDVGGVVRHELAHAMFTNMKRKGIFSIYQTQFYALNDIPMIDFETGYEKYISAEELYNYVSNMYWIVKADMTALNSFSPYFLNIVGGRMEQLDSIAKEIYVVTLNLIHKIETGILDEDYFISIANRESFFYLQAENIAVGVSSDYGNTLLSEGKKVIKFLNDNGLPQLSSPEEYPVQYQDEMRVIFDKMNEIDAEASERTLVRLKKLNKVAKFFMDENLILTDRFEQLKAVIESENKKSEQGLERDSTAVDIALKELKIELRTFINKSREWHPSFVGILN